MLLQVQQQSILIGRKPSGFTEHYYTEWDDGLGKQKIVLFLLLSINSTQVPGEDIGKEAFQLLQDHFLNDLDGDPYDRFEVALREINLMFTEQEKTLGVKFIPNINVIGGVIEKDMLFLSQRGDAHGYLIRKRHVSSISDGLFDPKNTEDVFQNIASGILEVNDSVVLATGKLVQYVTPGDMAKIFSEQTLEEGAKELKELLDADMEEQMALLSFEVLEKSGEALEVEEEVQMDLPLDEKEETQVEEKVAKTKLVQAQGLVKHLRVLRQWAAHKDRLSFLEHFKNVGREKILALIIIVVLALGGGTTYFVLNGGQKKQLKNMEAKLTVAEENVVQAETRGTFDKESAAGLLDDSEKLALEVMNSGLLRGKASDLLDRIGEQRDYLDNVIHVDDEIKEIADFSGLLGDDEIVGVTPYQDRTVVFTRTQAYQVLIDEVQEPTVIDNGERVIAGSYFPDPQNIVFLTQSGKVIEYKEGNSQFADTADVDWKAGIAVVPYSSRIYMLDREGGQIWKYTRGRAGYGSAQPYLPEEETGVDLTQAMDLAIDGSVWVLMDNGDITQLISGVNEPFRILKAPLASLENATRIYTELDVGQIFVLDPSDNRLFVYQKSPSSTDISYSAQYVLERVKGKLVDMYVDKEKDVYVIVTDKGLYEMSF